MYISINDIKMPKVAISEEDVIQRINDIAFNNAEDYSSVKLALCELADFKRNISWKIDEKRNLIIRNANNSSNPNSNYADYALQMLNIGSAAFDLLSIHLNSNPNYSPALKNHIARIRVKVSEISKNFLKELFEMKNNTSSEYREKLIDMNTQIVDVIQDIFPKYGKEKINKILGKASNYTALNSTHYNIATIYKVDDEIFVQLNEKIVKKTLKQKDEYSKRKEKEWYKALDIEEQKLIDHHINAILDDEHMIPIQASRLIGLRNAYKTSLFQKNANNDSLNLLTEYIRSSSPIILNKNSKIPDLHPLNKEQLIEVLGDKDKLNVISLNSSVRFINKISSSLKTEYQIVKESNKLFDVQGDRRITFINIPINFLRIFTTNNFQTVVNQKIKDIAVELFDEINLSIESNDTANQQKLNFLNKFLKSQRTVWTSKSYKKSLELLRTIPITVDQKSLLKQLLDLKNTLNQTKGLVNNVKILLKYENYNIKLVAQLQNVMVQYNKHFPNKPKEVNAISCKSGKDRTSSVTTSITFNAIKHSNPKLDEKKILKSIIDSSGDQILSSINAGTAGRFGTKYISKEKFKSNDNKNLQQPTAGFTEGFPIISVPIMKKIKGIIKRFFVQNIDKNNTFELISYKKIDQNEIIPTQDVSKQYQAMNSIKTHLQVHNSKLKNSDEVTVKNAVKPSTVPKMKKIKGIIRRFFMQNTDKKDTVGLISYKKIDQNEIIPTQDVSKQYQAMNSTKIHLQEHNSKLKNTDEVTAKNAANPSTAPRMKKIKGITKRLFVQNTDKNNTVELISYKKIDQNEIIPTQDVNKQYQAMNSTKTHLQEHNSKLKNSDEVTVKNAVKPSNIIQQPSLLTNVDKDLYR